MADGQQYDTSQLDTVQHPTLGTLKFPRSMPYEERNSIIDGMESTPLNQAKSLIGEFNTGATGAPTGQGLWQNIKDQAKEFMDKGPISYASDKIQGIVDAGSEYTKYPTDDLRRYQGAVPLVGSTLNDITNTSMEKGPAAGIARGAGAATSLYVGAKAPGAIADYAGTLPEDLAASRAAKAQNLYERTVAPGGLKAEAQQTMRGAYSRGAPFLADEARLNGPVRGGEGGVIRTADRVASTKYQLWDKNVAPVIDQFGSVQDPTVPEIGQKIRADLTDLNKTKPGAAPAAERLAQVFDKPMDVKTMADTVRELNNDRAVSRYYQMSDAERFAAETNDPALRHKVDALSMLRDKMVNTIGEAGGEQLGQSFAEFRKAYGGLSDMEGRLRDTNVPTPLPLSQRVANTMRLSLSPGAAREYINKPVDTLFDMSNPNRLATKSFNKLGKTNLTAPTAAKAVPKAVPTVAPAPPAPPPGPVSQVGAPPPMGFQATLPDQMWTGTSGPFQPGWQVPGSSVTSQDVPGVQPTAVDLPDSLTTMGRPDVPQGQRGLTDAQMRGMPSFMRDAMSNPTPRPGEYSTPDVGPDRSPLPHPDTDEGGAAVPDVTPPTDLTASPNSVPNDQVLPEQIQPDFVDQSVHPWQSEARVQAKQGKIQQGEDATIVARQNPDGSYSPVKGHQSPVAASREGAPVNVVDAGPITDGEKAAMTAESHFFPQDDHAVPADLGKDAASERASLPDEVKAAPAMPAKEGPQSNVIQRGNPPEEEEGLLPEQLGIPEPNPQELADIRQDAGLAPGDLQATQERIRGRSQVDQDIARTARKKK
jgi:hypothetical protein